MNSGRTSQVPDCLYNSISNIGIMLTVDHMPPGSLKIELTVCVGIIWRSSVLAYPESAHLSQKSSLLGLLIYKVCINTRSRFSNGCLILFPLICAWRTQ
jgi:hypothetical protein